MDISSWLSVNQRWNGHFFLVVSKTKVELIFLLDSQEMSISPLVYWLLRRNVNSPFVLLNLVIPPFIYWLQEEMLIPPLFYWLPRRNGHSIFYLLNPRRNGYSIFYLLTPRRNGHFTFGSKPKVKWTFLLDSQ
jgi:hypothetical protein